MPDRPQHSNSKLISEQAADWLLRFRDGELSINDRHEYVQWLKQSPLHVREILELSALQGLLRSSDLTGMPPPRKPSAMPEGVSSIVDLIPQHHKEDGPSDERRQSSWHHWKSAASGCLARIEFAGRAISRFVGIRG